MARKGTMYSCMLVTVIVYGVYKYALHSGTTDVIPPVAIYRMSFGNTSSESRITTSREASLLVKQRTTAAVAAMTTLDANSACQLERQLFISQEQLSQFSVSYSPRYVPARKLDTLELGSLVSLLASVTLFLNRNQISYVLGYNSLLGSYVMHDLLPYDDKFQLLAKLSIKETLSKAIAKDDKLTITEHSSGKLRYTHTRFLLKTSGEINHWPFVELHYYDENSTHVWTTMPSPLEVVVKRASFYPFHDRPLSKLWLPAPKEPLTFLLQVYSRNEYVSFSWDHRINAAEIPTTIKWRIMLKRYPFVFRINCGDGAKETLRYQGVDQYNVYIDECFPNKTSIAGLG